MQQIQMPQKRKKNPEDAYKFNLSRAEADLSKTVLPGLSEFMIVEAVLGKNETVSILHSDKLFFPLKYVDYDPEYQRMILISTKGKLQPLGIEIPEEWEPIIMKSKEISLMRTKIGKGLIEDFYIVPLINSLTRPVKKTVN